MLSDQSRRYLISFVIDDTHIEWHFTQACDRTAQLGETEANPLPEHGAPPRRARRRTVQGPTCEPGPANPGR